MDMQAALLQCAARSAHLVMGPALRFGARRLLVVK